ncbi:FAD-dependent oxidoreductase [Microvirga massiliensis]|uniref:FAD-dependent oxidoreductase n=1 Tax=Microvirga massiliensis TaxID=1033741 RepID=UPI00062BB07F|nr:FAD-dependent oxidoreductase [Microvirga massiliensis]
MRLQTRNPNRGGPTIVFEGRPLAAIDGESVAAALFAHGEVALCRGKDGVAHGVFCGMGVCHDCLVTIDGRASQRACMTKVREGMRVTRQSAGCLVLSSDLTDLVEVPGSSPTERRVDVAIVGAGPGGLTAAETARRAGASVLVIDERPAPGGQFFKQPASAAAILSGGVDRQTRDGAALIARAQALGVEFADEALVWGAFRDPEGGIELATVRHGQVQIVRPRMLIIATGAYERPHMVPGWTLPGVITTGACQTLVRSYGVAPGRRVLVAGNGPLNLQVAAELLRGGAEVVAVAEAAPAPWTRPIQSLGLWLAAPQLAALGLGLVGRLAQARTSVLWGHVLRRIDGDGRAERAILSLLGPDGTPLEGRDVALEADAVCVGYGFLPSSELPRLLGCRHRSVSSGSPHPEVERGDDGSTSLPDVFVVGEAGGFGGAHIAMAQGRLAAAEASRRLDLSVPGNTARTRRMLARHRRFQSGLARLFAAPDLGLSCTDDETPVCRCEAVTLGRLRAIIANARVTDVPTLKRLTRAGMGRCQGRYCAPRLHELVEGTTPATELGFLAPQVPLRPTPLAALAVEKPEWGGHKRALLPDCDSPKGESLPINQADTVVIGAGIVGLSTALFLARAGREVVVIDRGKPNSLASGGNAGSLHAQLLSFDYGSKAEAGGTPAVRTLKLQLEAIDLWRRLEMELEADFEIKVTGGVMVAETERDLAFLHAKTRAEREQGIECGVINAAELRQLEPALDKRFIGAAYCPQEGKINPLIATQGILDAALARGARIVADTEVRAIRRNAPGFEIDTQRGTIRAGRIVNAAGSFAGRIGSMLGLDLPVFGAPLQMIVTEAVEPLVSRLVAHADRHLTLKQAANGNFIIGGGWTAGLDAVHQQPRPLRASIEGNLWVAQRVLPALRKLHVLRTWAAMNINIDGAPILGEHPAAPGFYNAVTSNGYTLGPIMGLTTAELILQGRAERDISAFTVARFGA